jgi:hypothetical protein
LCSLWQTACRQDISYKRDFQLPILLSAMNIIGPTHLPQRHIMHGRDMPSNVYAFSTSLKSKPHLAFQECKQTYVRGLHMEQKIGVEHR